MLPEAGPGLVQVVRPACTEPGPFLVFTTMNQTVPLALNCDIRRVSEAPGERSWPLWRAAFLVFVLVGEILLLTLRFDAERIAQETGLWAWLLANASRFLRAFIAMAVATLLFGGVRLWRDYLVLAKEKTAAVRWPFFVVGHVTAFLAFAYLTALIFEGDVLSSSQAGGWACAWIGLALTTFGFWLAAILPPTAWWPLMRQNARPLCAGMAVGLAAWGLGLISSQLWVPLSEATFWTTQSLLSLFTSDLVCQTDDFLLGTSAFAVYISPECSGYEGIGLMLMFLGFYVWLFRKTLRFPHVWLLFPMGVILIWLANSVRIAALIGIGSAGWPEVAQGGFHSQAGWLAFNGLALGFVVLSRNVRFFQANTTPVAVSEADHPTVAHLAPWMAILAASMICGALTSGFDWLYPVRVLAALAVLCSFRHAYGRWDWSVSWQAIALGAATFGIWLLLAPADMFEDTGFPEALTGSSRGLAIAWLAFRLLGYVVTVPLAEELAFRGYLTRRLVDRYFDQVEPARITWWSVALTSVLFGAMHGRCWMAGILAGVLFAVAFRRRGRLADAVTAHATTNALIAVYVLSTGKWLMWS